MGIATGTFQLILQEHRARPFRGSILTLGKQDIYLTRADVCFWADYYGAPYADIDEPELSSKTRFAGKNYLSDRALFSFLGVEVESLDNSTYERCDHIADLNASELPESLAGRYDVVLDLGTFEHVFHLPNAFRFCHGLLKERGRMIHMSPLGNYADHGFYMMSPMLFHDFYETNGWRLLQMKIIRHSRNHDTEPYWATDYSPEHFACLSFGGLGDGLYQTFTVAEKLPNSTGYLVPQQRLHRLKGWGGRLSEGVSQPQAKMEKTIVERIRDRLGHHWKWIQALRAAHSDLHIVIFGAGLHTKLLLRVWHELKLPEPKCIFQSEAPSSNSFEGLPLVALDNLKQEPKPHLIVLSSQRYETDMDIICERAFPITPTLRFWT